MNPPKYPCTACGGDAYIGYKAGKQKGHDWGGKVKPGEHLCTRCFRARSGYNCFSRPPAKAAK